jgi:hypothetical protein
VFLGLNRGELVLVAIIFGLIYASGLLPRIASRIAGSEAKGSEEPKGD